jgi:hypothetical protein
MRKVAAAARAGSWSRGGPPGRSCIVGPAEVVELEHGRRRLGAEATSISAVLTKSCSREALKSFAAAPTDRRENGRTARQLRRSVLFAREVAGQSLAGGREC